MALADMRIGFDPWEVEKFLKKEHSRFMRLSREEVAAKMNPLGFTYDVADKTWSKAGAWDEYESILRIERAWER